MVSRAESQLQEGRLIRGNWLVVPKSLVRDREALKLALTVPNGSHFASMNAGMETTSDPYFICYKELQDAFLIPRNAEQAVADLLPRRAFENVVDNVVKAAIFPKYHVKPWPNRIKLYPHQVKPAKLMVEEWGDKILSLACGKGKTVVTLHSLCEDAPHNLPALVVVHTQVLMEQWIKMIRRHVCMGLDTVGRIQGEVCDVKGHAFVVGMLQSLVQREYPSWIYEHFRVVVYDEVHRLGAPQFSKVAPMFLGTRWGLSATHKRQDGNDKVFKLHCGQVIYTDLEQELQPKVYFVQTRMQVNLERMRLYRNPSKLNFAKLTNVLSDDEARNNLIMDYVHRAASKQRTGLILGERVEQLLMMASQCQVSASPLVGPMKAKDREEALTKQMVFATSSLAKEGLDRPLFDTLFVIIPSANPAWLQQAFGRILRVHADKREPRVIIFEDAEVGPMVHRCNKIRDWLRKHRIQFTIVKGDSRV